METTAAVPVTATPRFGAFLVAAQFPEQGHDEVLAGAVAAAMAAEAAGFDDVWVAEHHFMTYGVCPSAITLAGYLLGRTTRIEVGTAVSVLSTQHPVALAEQTALLDHLSGGRFRLGVGRGGPWVDLEVFGTGARRYDSGLPEALDVLLAALTRDRVGGAGPHFSFRPVPLVPRPRTRPRPSVHLACTSPETARLGGVRGLPLLLGLQATDAEKRAMIATHAAAAGAGHVPGTVPHMAACLAHVEDSTAAARTRLRAALPRWLGPGLAGYRPLDGRPRPRRDPDDYAAFLCAEHAVGDADHCADRLARTVTETGIDHLILLVEGTGEPARTLDNIARLGAEVIPAVRAALAGHPVNSRRTPVAG